MTHGFSLSARMLGACVGLVYLVTACHAAPTTDLARFEVTLSRALRARLAFAPGGDVRVSLPAATRRVVGGRELISFPGAVVEMTRIQVKSAVVERARLTLAGLELDHNKLCVGRFESTGATEASLHVSLDQTAVIAPLKEMRARCDRIEFQDGAVVLSGQTSAGLISVPFRAIGRPALCGSSVGIRVVSLSVCGKPATPDMLRTARSSAASLVPLSTTLAPIGIRSLRVSGGQFELLRDGATAYTTTLTDIGVAE